MRILTYPTGLVVGELEVKADLGPQGRAAAFRRAARGAYMSVRGPYQIRDTKAKPLTAIDSVRGQNQLWPARATTM